MMFSLCLALLTPLPPGAVHLTGGLSNELSRSVEKWHKGDVPYHEFAAFFDKGRPQFALGEMWGKFVRSGAMQYRHAPDAGLKWVLDAAVRDLLAVQRANGSFSCVPPEKQPDDKGGDLWERKYVMLGLEDYYEWVERSPKVLEALIAHADVLLDQIGPKPKTEILSLGWSPNHVESATLLEPMLRLHALTGEKRYLEFARYVIRAGGARGSDLAAEARAGVPTWKMASGDYPKAYEMTSYFEGLAEYVRQTGDASARTACCGYFESVLTNELTIVGNGGGDMPHYPKYWGETWDNTAREQTNPAIRRMMETCTGVTWMKYAGRILALTQDARAGDAIERYVLNGLLGAMKPSGDGFSYVNLLNGHKVTDEGWGWRFPSGPVTCCNLNGPMGLAYVPYLAVLQGERGPVVNLYNPLTARVRVGSQEITLDMATDFPASGHVRIAVAGEGTFPLTVRLPAWSARTVVRVNGQVVHEAGGRAEFFPIERAWTSGDAVELDFDMACRVVSAPRGSDRAGDDFTAVTYGPVVLCRDENTDPQYDQPVEVVASTEGAVRAERVAPTREGTRLEFRVPTDSGEIRMIDYASQDGWHGKRVQTWLPRKKGSLRKQETRNLKNEQERKTL